MDFKDALRSDVEHDGRPDEKIFQFQAREPVAPEPAVPSNPAKRDWPWTIDLIKDASETVRRAEERVRTVEDQARHLASFHAEQLRSAVARATAAEKKADAALARAAEAEAWLARVHDAVVDGFGQRGTRHRLPAKGA